MAIVARVERDFRRVLLSGVVALIVALPTLGQTSPDERWVATWATALVAHPLPPATPPAGAAPPAGAPAPAQAPSGAAPPRPPPPVTASNQTLRQVVHTSVGGERVRVVLSNVFGTAPLEVAAAAIGPRAQSPGVRAAGVHPLTFGGGKSAAILPGAVLVSDPVDMAVAPLSDVVVDLYLPGDLGIGPSPVTTHNGASQTNYLSASGNHVGAVNLPLDKEMGAWFLLARIEVVARPKPASSSPSATRSRTAHARHRTPTRAGPISLRVG